MKNQEVYKSLFPLEHFTVFSNKYPLSLWGRRPTEPKGIILLLHGQTWSSLTVFDLQVKGKQRSILQAFAEYGYAAFALDFRGYGKTPRNKTNWLTPNQAVDDVVVSLEWLIIRYPHLMAPTLLGWSNGSLVAQLTAQLYPYLISNLVLYGYPIDPDEKFISNLDIIESSSLLNDETNAKSDFITPEVISTDVVAAFVKSALQMDPIRIEWQNLDEWNKLDPAKVETPTLLIHGEHDPYTRVESQTKLFARLLSDDRRWVVLPKGDHVAHIENTMPAFINSVSNFVDHLNY